MSTGEHISTRFFVKEKVTASTAYSFRTNNNISLTILLCGLVVRVSGYRYRGPGFDSRHCQIFLSLLSLVSLLRSIEELLE